MKTLCIHRPYGLMLLRAALILLILVGVLEAAARTELAENHLHVPGLDSYVVLEVNLAYLEKYGPVDCIFLGNSVVEWGINPAIFTDALATRTGEKLRCFNFGIPAMNIISAAKIAKILVERYQPHYLFYGVNPIEFVVPDELNLLESDWVRYQTGEFNVSGWLLSHSAAYRYYRRYQTWRLADFSETLAGVENYQDSILPNGYSPLYRVLLDVEQPPDTEVEAEVYQYVHEYGIEENRLKALEDLIHLNSETQIIFFEAPLHPSYAGIFANGIADYQYFLDTVGGKIRQHGLPFLETTSLYLIPDTAWADRAHLLFTGSAMFSHWLGLQIGEAIKQESWENVPEITIPPLSDILPADKLTFPESDIVSPDAVIFNPMMPPIDTELLWYNVALYQKAISPSEDGLALMTLLKRTQFESDLANPISAWRNSKLPDDLKGVADYLLVTDSWLGWLSSEELQILQDNYLLIREFRHPALNVVFYLYKIP